MPVMKIDLHCHTDASDGQLSPVALISKAVEKQISVLAITDHDTLRAYRDLRVQNEVGQFAMPANTLSLYSGVELSCLWSNMDIHVIGLDIDIDHPLMLEALAQQKLLRLQRAERIGKKLEARGVKNALEESWRFAKGDNIGRPHFARLLIEKGRVKDFKQAFEQYLGPGKQAYSSCEWPEIEQALKWIKEAGGQGVLAHPLRYRLTAAKLRRLVQYFKDSGGDALEFSGGIHNKDKLLLLSHLCQHHDLAVSLGSDFHSEDNSWQQLGVTAAMPAGLRGVWEAFGQPFL